MHRNGVADGAWAPAAARRRPEQSWRPRMERTGVRPVTVASTRHTRRVCRVHRRWSSVKGEGGCTRPPRPTAARRPLLKAETPTSESEMLLVGSRRGGASRGPHGDSVSCLAWGRRSGAASSACGAVWPHSGSAPRFPARILNKRPAHLPTVTSMTRGHRRSPQGQFLSLRTDTR